MKSKNKRILILSIVMSLYMTGCSETFTETIPTPPVYELDDSSVIHEGPFQEDKRIYDYDIDNSVINLYVTVLDRKHNKSHSFFDLNHWYAIHDITTDSPKLEVIVQEGGDQGPEKGFWGYGTNIVNASIQIRGESSRANVQKSYKLKLYENAGLWKGQTTLNLNKHSFEFLKIRNKLSFDYFKLVPNLTSLRTQFVHLYVKDLTSDTSNGEFGDYGLFTHIEQPNKRFLAARNLDPNGQLYKAIMFEFFRYPNEIKLSTDPSYDEKAFESVLEIKGSNDHSKLIKMLDAVNNDHLNINDVIDTYFDRDNYITWLAVNILMDNVDTDARNFILYSPLNSNKFIFIPWDYDGGWGYKEEAGYSVKNFTAKWQLGISNYWGVVLHQRFFKDPTNIKELTSKIDELTKIINEDQTKKLLATYYPVVSEFVKSSPDVNYLPDRIENYDYSYNNLANVTKKSLEIFHTTIENPMPVYLGDPYMIDDFYEFTWDHSYDLQGDDITYDFQISQFIDFSSVYIEKTNYSGISVEIPVNDLIKGENYWRVIIKDSKGHTQVAFDRIMVDDVTVFNGIKEFYVD